MRRSSCALVPGLAARCGATALVGLTPLLAAVLPAAAGVRHVPARPGAAQQALDASAAGDTVLLAPGLHAGPLRVRRPVTLRGGKGVRVDGGGKGTVIEVGASQAVVADLEVRGSGRRVLSVDCGIRVTGARGVRIERVVLGDVLYGIYAERADSLAVRDAVLEGRVRPLDEAGEGNGIHLWSCADATLAGNSVSHFLDAIYLSFADRTHVTRNRLSDNGRYGLHTMYCQRNRLVENAFSGNAAGIAIMFSDRLRVENNAITHNRGPRTYGLLLRDCSDGHFLHNRLVDNTVALFLDGSNRNRFRRNLIQDNGWGILLFGSCADNSWAWNDFIQNDVPVALDMRRTRNQFDDGANGNFWSDAGTYDLDGDGVGDVPHGPVTAFAFVSKRYPDLAVLAKSPAVAALAVAERVFPTLRPSEAMDRFPLTRPAGGRAALGVAAPRRPQRSWAHVAGFGVLLSVGLAGLVGARRR